MCSSYQLWIWHNFQLTVLPNSDFPKGYNFASLDYDARGGTHRKGSICKSDLRRDGRSREKWVPASWKMASCAREKATCASLGWSSRETTNVEFKAGSNSRGLKTPLSSRERNNNIRHREGKGKPEPTKAQKDAARCVRIFK